MWTAILAALTQSWFGQIVSAVLGFFQKKAADQNAATQAEGQAETQHQNDGAQSVADKVSDDAQNADLDQQAKQIDNPNPPGNPVH